MKTCFSVEEIRETIKRIDSKFQSGNNIPVERNFITREEYEVLKISAEHYARFCEEVRRLNIQPSPNAVNFGVENRGSV